MADIVICDDREEILKDIEAKIRKADVQGVHRILSYNHGMRMMADIEDQLARAEIFILDIALGACSGISLAQEILSFIPDAQIIFMSGYDAYYEDVYDVNHIYFLQKPVREEALTKALATAHNHLLEAKQNCFYVENKSGRFVVPYSKIFIFEKQNRKIILRGKEGAEICSFYGKFKEILPQLPTHFCRCHNGIIVNMEKTAKISQNSFIMQDGQYVAISRSHRNTALCAFASYTCQTI